MDKLITRKFKVEGKDWTIVEIAEFSNPQTQATAVDEMLAEMSNQELKFIFPDKKIK